MSGSEHPLDFVFHPRHVAVVGASPGAMGMSGGFVAGFIDMGFKGPIYPINPRYEEVAGLKCYPSVRDVPTDVDYVVSSVPAPIVPRMVEDCGAKNVRVIHFFTAGFTETGEEERIELQESVIRRTKELGIRAIGPNCMGLYVPGSGLSFNQGFPREAGNVGLISQSGANASEFVGQGGGRGLRFSKVISYGNAADLCEADFFDYIAEDPETEIVAAYLEGVRDGRRFVQALKKCAALKPVVILKGGRTAAGGRATQSHTASLAGPIRIFDSVCRQAGVIRVDGMDELVDLVIAFRDVKKLSGPNACLIVGGGGRSVLSADDVAAEGLDVPHLPPETQAQLREFTPIAGTSIRNPIDSSMGFRGADDDSAMKTLQIAASASNIDFVLYNTGMGWGPRRPAVPAGATPAEPGAQPAPRRGRRAAGGAPGDPFAGIDFEAMARRQIDNIISARKDVGKPIILSISPPGSAQAFPGYEAMTSAASDAGIAVFPTVRRAALALSRLLQWERMQGEIHS